MYSLRISEMVAGGVSSSSPLTQLSEKRRYEAFLMSPPPLPTCSSAVFSRQSGHRYDEGTAPSPFAHDLILLSSLQCSQDAQHITMVMPYMFLVVFFRFFMLFPI